MALAGAAIAIGLYFLLIPPFSFIGAAWATVAALCCLAAIVLTVSNRIYPVPWDWHRIALAFGLTVGAALLSLGIDSWLSVGVSIPVRIAITLAYPLLLYALGFFPPGDLAAARSRFRKVLRLA
jgi:O-antigen/teichoic acid export membrane protein